MFHNKFKQNDPVAEAIAQIAEADYKAKMEALKGDQHKLDKNKNNKLDAHDFAILRGEKKSVKEEEQLDELSSKTRSSYANKARASAGSNRMMADLSREAGDKEGAKKYDDKAKKREAGYNKIANPIKKHFGMKVEGEQVEEGWDDMMKAAKERRGPQPSGGSGKKAGSRYGGSNQKREPVKERLEPNVKSHDGLKGPAPGESPNKMRSNKVKFVPEEQEQIDELSKKTLGDYVKKASHDVAHKGALTRKHAMDSDAAKEKQDYVGARKSMEKADKTFAKSWKRREGMAKAVDRLTKEESEQIDELSKKTLGSYVKAAAKDAEQAGRDQEYHGHENDYARGEKRQKGVAKAVDRLTKEDVEQVDERELSKGETKEKERIVKGMKKSFAGFRARYGDRAKSVMYATATKAAKDD